MLILSCCGMLQLPIVAGEVNASPDLQVNQIGHPLLQSGMVQSTWSAPSASPVAPTSEARLWWPACLHSLLWRSTGPVWPAGGLAWPAAQLPVASCTCPKYSLLPVLHFFCGAQARQSGQSGHGHTDLPAALAAARGLRGAADRGGAGQAWATARQAAAGGGLWWRPLTLCALLPKLESAMPHGFHACCVPFSPLQLLTTMLHRGLVLDELHPDGPHSWEPGSHAMWMGLARTPGSQVVRRLDIKARQS